MRLQVRKVSKTMAVELFPEMAENVFRPVLERLEQNGGAREFSPAEIRDLLSACGIAATVLERTFAAYRVILRRGVEKEKLRGLQEQFLNVIESAIGRTYPAVRRIAAGEALPAPERGSELEALDSYAQQARAIAEELKNLKSWLELSRPKIDVSAWGAPIAHGDYGNYEDSDDIEARLRAGGDF